MSRCHALSVWKCKCSFVQARSHLHFHTESPLIVTHKKGRRLSSSPFSHTFKTEYTMTFLIKTTILSYHLDWTSPRPISNSQLHALLHFHLCPINLIVFKGTYFQRMGYLILRGASRLDAFSVYPVPAWLLCRALGRTTDTPAASPPRSSRTRGSSSQKSYAYAG